MESPQQPPIATQQSTPFPSGALKFSVLLFALWAIMLTFAGVINTCAEAFPPVMMVYVLVVVVMVLATVFMALFWIVYLLVWGVWGAAKGSVATMDAALTMRFLSTARQKGWFLDRERLLPKEYDRLAPALRSLSGSKWLLERDEVLLTPICHNDLSDAENLTRLHHFWRIWKSDGA